VLLADVGGALERRCERGVAPAGDAGGTEPTSEFSEAPITPRTDARRTAYLMTSSA
jgi:hypothetical protein